MVNLKYDINRIEEEKGNLAIVHELEELQQKINEYTKVADYLTKARYIVSPSQEWINDIDVSLDNLSITLKMVKIVLEKLQSLRD